MTAGAFLLEMTATTITAKMPKISPITNQPPTLRPFALATAAAHELGTPLATIQVVAKELQRASAPESDAAEDAAEGEPHAECFVHEPSLAGWLRMASGMFTVLRRRRWKS